MGSIRALRIASLSFTHFGGRDYNEDSIGECEAFGAVRLFMLADGAGGKEAEMSPPKLLSRRRGRCFLACLFFA